MAGGGDVVAIRGEPNSSDRLVMFKRANLSLPIPNVPDVRVIVAHASPSGKPSRVWGDVDCKHCVSALHTSTVHEPPSSNPTFTPVQNM